VKKNPDYPSGLVIMTHTHDDFECPSLRDYVDTKSRLAYEKNPLFDTLSTVKHCIDENLAFSNMMCVHRQ
jgi:hypothetical protein